MKLILALAGLMCILLTGSQVNHANAASLQVLGDTAGLSFSAAAPETEVWIQVKVPPELDATNVQPRVQAVLFDKKPDPESFPRFTVDSKLAASKDKQPSIVLKVSQIDKMPPGIYTVTLDFIGGTSTIDPLTLNIERRAAQFAAAAKQVVEVTLSAPLVEGAVAPESLWLYAASDKRSSAVRDVTVSHDPFKKADGTPASGQLKPSLPASAASAGQALKVAFSPKDFSVGTATTKVVVDSPDFKAPLSFEVEVRTKRSWVWLVLTVLAGIAVGFFLRVFLTHRLELGAGQDRAAELLLTVSSEVERTPDETFRTAVYEETASLKAVVAMDKSADINAAVTKLEAKLAAALLDLRNRLEQVRAEVKGAAEVAVTAGVLPGSMRPALSVLREQAEQVLEKVLARDADGAGRLLIDSVRALCGELQSCGGKEHSLFVQSAARYADFRPLMDERKLAVGRKDPLVDIGKDDGLFPPESLADIASARTYLNVWLGAARRRQSGMNFLAGFIDQDAKELVALSAAKAGGSSAALVERGNEVLASAQLVVVEVRSLLTKEAFLSIPEPDVPRALSAYAQILLEVKKQRPNAPAEVWAAYTQGLNSKHYFQTLASLPDPTTQELEETQELSAGGEVSLLPFGGPALPATSAPPIDSATVRVLGSRYSKEIPLDSPQALRAYRARTKWQIAMLSVTQTVGVAVVLAVASYAVFGERFIGTYSELAGLFFWGFTADLSVAKLTDLAGGISAKPKA